MGLDKAENPPELHSHGPLSCTQHFRAGWKGGRKSHCAENSSSFPPSPPLGLSYPAAASFLYLDSKLVILFLVKSCFVSSEMCLSARLQSRGVVLFCRQSLSQTAAPRVPGADPAQHRTFTCFFNSQAAQENHQQRGTAHKLGKAQCGFQKGQVLCSREGVKGENKGRKAGGVGKKTEEGKEMEERGQGCHIPTQ